MQREALLNAKGLTSECGLTWQNQLLWERLLPDLETASFLNARKKLKVRKEEPVQKMLDFDWESSEVGGEVVNAVREVVAPGSGKFPATKHPTHSSSLSCSNETCKLLKCSPTTSTIAPQRRISRAAELCQVLHLVCRHRAQSESSDSVL